MAKLVEGIADLLALRDRHALDHAFATLVARQLPEAPRSVAIFRRVGDPADERWLTGADVTPGTPGNSPTPEVTDPTQWPALADFPDRLKALNASGPTQFVDHLAQGQSVTLFPMAEDFSVPGVMEIRTTQPMPEATRDLVLGLLHVYRNFRSLLDYGERDTLTDLLNRKTFEGAFIKALMEKRGAPTEPAHDRRVSSPVGSNWLGMLDIDHFKRVNDNFGHLIGDEVLLLMARLMRSNFRFHDELYRFGGEEFVVLLRHVDVAGAAHVFERLRERTESFGFPQVGNITVSVGYTALRVDDTPDIAFARADKAVYFGKGHGRNQVCNYEALIAQGKLVEADANVGDVELF